MGERAKLGRHCQVAKKWFERKHHHACQRGSEAVGGVTARQWPRFGLKANLPDNVAESEEMVRTISVKCDPGALLVQPKRRDQSERNQGSEVS
jgi:hypothetical protein